MSTPDRELFKYDTPPGFQTVEDSQRASALHAYLEGVLNIVANVTGLFSLDLIARALCAWKTIKDACRGKAIKKIKRVCKETEPGE